MEKNQIKELISDIRSEIDHEEAEVIIKEIIFNKEEQELIIITPDRPDKSIVVGKGGWVVGRLKEKLGIKKIHVTDFAHILQKTYQMKLALKKINTLLLQDILPHPVPWYNIKRLLIRRIEYPYNFDFLKYFNLNYPQNQLKTSDTPEGYNIKKEGHEALVAVSGGVDSGFSLIIAKFLGFNPLAVTVDPGTIILPNHFKKNIQNLTQALGIPHHYLELNLGEIIENSLEGRYHPCGRCSKSIHQKIYEYANENDIKVIIFGDLLSSGFQSVSLQYGLIKINLPALLGVSKQEIKELTTNFGLKPVSGFGCPLLVEVEKKFPHMARYSIQRVLRETRAGALEPGEALEIIWSSCKHFK